MKISNVLYRTVYNNRVEFTHSARRHICNTIQNRIKDPHDVVCISNSVSTKNFMGYSKRNFTSSSNKNMSEFDPKLFEKKWQDKWDKSQLYNTQESENLPKSYVLDMFPYPSGKSMHVGHPRGYVATDVYSRFKRMSGYNVLHPMGWDAFGLPAEETAIEKQEHPSITVKENINIFKNQLNRLGIGYDWSKEINTTSPNFYCHTQRIFLEFFRMGLAYNAVIPVNWCDALGTVLANEDIINGKSERGNHPVVQKPMRQWILGITKYADRLIDDLDKLSEWPEKIKTAQKNWIGKSQGYTLYFNTTSEIKIPVFTNRIELIGGVDFIAIAPDSDIATMLQKYSHNRDDIKNYIEKTRYKTNFDRQNSKEKNVVVIQGIHAINPILNKKIPIFIADCILSSNGTGALMCTPAYNKLDLELAKVINISPTIVIKDNKLINSGRFSGISMMDAHELIAKSLDAKEKTIFKMQDWVFSRQRFWGEPFPIIWISGRSNYDLFFLGDVKSWLPKEPITYKEGDIEYFAVPIIPKYLSSAQLPLVDSYNPTGTIQGPLAGIEQWVKVFIDPKTGKVFENNINNPSGLISGNRETNTMPQWAGSSWYWTRYIDPNNTKEPFSKSIAKHWLPVDVYAGADHAVAHLLYARFWYKVMYDIGMVESDEPFKRLEFLGYVLDSDGKKISKRTGNATSPDKIIDQFGADTLRLYEMFMGPFNKAVPWNDDYLKGTYRFLEKVWKFSNRIISENYVSTDDSAMRDLNKTMDKVTKDIEKFKFNTAVSSMMSFLKNNNDRNFTKQDLSLFVKILAPFAPHISEEIWSNLDINNNSIHISSWPTKANDLSSTLDNSKLPICINGKKITEIIVKKDITEKELKNIILSNDIVKLQTTLSNAKKIVYIPGRIFNIVT